MSDAADHLATLADGMTTDNVVERFGEMVDFAVSEETWVRAQGSRPLECLRGALVSWFDSMQATRAWAEEALTAMSEGDLAALEALNDRGYAVGAAVGAASLEAQTASCAGSPFAGPIAFATAAPTATPTPTVAPTVAPTKAPTPAPTAAPIRPVLKKTTGRGDKIVRFKPQDAPTLARITGRGGGNFAVISYAGSDYDDLLVNEIGSYAGWVYVAAGVDRLKITSSGTWSVEVRPIRAAKSWNGSSAITGKGDTVLRLSDGASGITTIKNRGNSNFAIVTYTPEGDYLDLVVNEIGSYSGEVMLPDADPMIIVIHAVDGSWSMSRIT
jgi:hypothetical protein